MDALTAYIDGWRRHDRQAILSCLTDDCMVIECYGPVYRGRDRVGQWFDVWTSAGGRVEEWTITSHAVAGATIVAEWDFTCVWEGRLATFQGATFARLADDRLVYLREYRTEADLYEWTGTWR